MFLRNGPMHQEKLKRSTDDENVTIHPCAIALARHTLVYKGFVTEQRHLIFENLGQRLLTRVLKWLPNLESIHVILESPSLGTKEITNALRHKHGDVFDFDCDVILPMITGAIAKSKTLLKVLQVGPSRSQANMDGGIYDVKILRLYPQGGDLSICTVCDSCSNWLSSGDRALSKLGVLRLTPQEPSLSSKMDFKIAISEALSKAILLEDLEIGPLYCRSVMDVENVLPGKPFSFHHLTHLKLHRIVVRDASVLLDFLSNHVRTLQTVQLHNSYHNVGSWTNTIGEGTTSWETILASIRDTMVFEKLRTFDVLEDNRALFKVAPYLLHRVDELQDLKHGVGGWGVHDDGWGAGYTSDGWGNSSGADNNSWG